MNSLTSATFHVSDVEPATKPLPEVPYKESVETLLTTVVSSADRQLIDQMRRSSSMPCPKPGSSRPIEACTRYHGRLLADISFHPVVAAIHHAFMDHRPLCLSPDMIWMMIIQGVANHVNANAEELRPQFVTHQGKILIEVRRDDFVKGSPENPWPEVFHEFSAKIRDHVGPKIDLFLPNFSTTGPVERASSEIVLLDAMQSYFDRLVRTICGIPAVTLEGTPEDWRSLAERAQRFAEFGLGPWLEVLVPILTQFTRASEGDVDLTFWRSLYRVNDQSGGPIITGWITAFFPYLKRGPATMRVNEFLDVTARPSRNRDTVLMNKKQRATRFRRFLELCFPSFVGKSARTSEILNASRTGGNLEEMLYPGEIRTAAFVRGPSIDRLPSSLSGSPFRWDYLDRTYDMEFLGGFVGVAQDQETLTLRPEIGWAVRESPPGV